MGFWGLLADIARAVAPHAAPHVARGIVNAARERMAPANAEHEAAKTDDLKQSLEAIQGKLSVIEERAAVAESHAFTAASQLARFQMQIRNWLVILLAWNLLVAALLVYLLFFRK